MGKPHGFTLIELLVVVAILGVLAAVTTIIINPVELLAQSRDATRFSDIDTLNKAIILAKTESQASNFSLGNTNTIYASIPDASSTCGDLSLPIIASGWAYSCVSSTSSKNINSTGWVPINFTSTYTGSQLNSLPIDPTNSPTTGLYYTYATDGTNYELTAYLESQKFKYRSPYIVGSILTLLGSATNPNAPTVVSISPTSGNNSGSISITSISGTNFASGATVQLTMSGQSNVVCTGFALTSSTTLSLGTCPISGVASGAWNVVVTNPNTQFGALSGGFTVTLLAPTVTAINPTSAVNSGSASITSVSGTNFVSGATVALTMSGQSNINCTGFTFTNSTTLSSGSCPITSAMPGTWNVVVTNPSMQSGTLSNGFTVSQQTGQVANFSPGSGQSWVVPAGITSVTIDAAGASGGGGGGYGGRAQGTISVTPGETLYISVGSQNGGMTWISNQSGFSQGTVFLTAGGGGAVGGSVSGGCSSGAGGAGGAGGGTTGGTGGYGNNNGYGQASGGGGGTSGGSGGGGAGGQGWNNDNGGGGSPGSSWSGGAGGGGCGCGGGTGGVGGNGFYGGGGGGGGSCGSMSYQFGGGGGGGGGSSYVSPSLTSTSITSGYESGNGYLTISNW